MFPLVQRSWMLMLSVSGLAVLILCLALATTAAQASDRTTAAPALLPPASLLLSPPPQDAGGASSNANLRQGPGTNYPVVGGVKAGAPLEIVAKNEAGDWYQLAPWTPPNGAAGCLNSFFNSLNGGVHELHDSVRCYPGL